MFFSPMFFTQQQFIVCPSRNYHYSDEEVRGFLAHIQLNPSLKLENF